MQVLKKLKEWRSHRFVPPLALLGLCLVSYGLYIGWMGFYWDDWPIVWFADVAGPRGLLWFEFQRPLAGLWFAATFALLGDSPLAWQILMLGLRWLTSLTAWWLLLGIWPRRKGLALGTAMLFAVFPGFGQQFVSVTGSRHLLGLALSLGSLALMIRVNQTGNKKRLLQAVSLGMAVTGMLITEYFYGLEILRPIVLWVAIDKKQRTLGSVGRAWLPYGAMLAAVFIWRQSITQFGNYDLVALDELSTSPIRSGGTFLVQILRDLWVATGQSWTQGLRLQQAFDLLGRARLYYWSLVAISGIGVFTILAQYEEEPVRKPKPLDIGILALLVGGGSIWVVGLSLKLAFPADRLMLPFLLGSALVVFAILRALPASKPLQNAMLAALVGLAVGSHFINALAYRSDWTRLSDFSQQLVWRAPGIQAGTTLISEELPIDYSTDNALTAVLNAMYAPDFNAPSDYFDYEYRIEEFLSVPVAMRYLDLRLGWQLPHPAEGMDYEAPYRYFKIRGNSEDVLLIYYQPPYCLRVLDPIYDAGHPHLLGADFYQEHPELLDPVFSPNFPALPNASAEMLPYSKPALIQAESTQTASMPPEWFGEPQGNETWCMFFEQAELARQVGDWDRVAQLATKALEGADGTHHASELPVFIEGYGQTGDWARAQSLTWEALDRDGAMQAMLCQTWSRLEGEESKSMLEELDCSREDR